MTIHIWHWQRTRFSREWDCLKCKKKIAAGESGYTCQVQKGSHQGWLKFHKNCLPKPKTEEGKRMVSEWKEEDKLAKKNKWPWGSVRCDHCGGTGQYRWGATVNGVPTHSGECFQCLTKGFQTLEDQMRTNSYYNHIAWL